MSIHVSVLLSKNLSGKWEFDHSEYSEQSAANTRALNFNIFSFHTKAKSGSLNKEWELWQVVRGFELGCLLFSMCFVQWLNSNKVVFPCWNDGTEIFFAISRVTDHLWLLRFPEGKNRKFLNSVRTSKWEELN